MASESTERRTNALVTFQINLKNRARFFDIAIEVDLTMITPETHIGPPLAETKLDSIVSSERRSEDRIETNYPASLSLLSEDSGAIPTLIVEISGSGLKIELNLPLEPGALVRVNHQDSLLLGEVVWCSGDRVPYLAGIRIEHSLLNLTRIQSLARDFLGDQRRT